MIYSDSLQRQPLVDAQSIRNIKVSETSPLDLQVLRYIGATKEWTPQALPTAQSPLQLIQTIEITGAPTDNITFTGLNGDLDHAYIIKGRVFTSPTQSYDHIYVLRPNNITTNQKGIAIRGYELGVSNLNTSAMTLGFVSIVNVINTVHLLEGYLYARTGAKRFLSAKFVREIYQTYPWIEEWGSVWDDTTTNITSLSIIPIRTDGIIISDGIGIGSSVSLYKVLQQ